MSDGNFGACLIVALMMLAFGAFLIAHFAFGGS